MAQQIDIVVGVAGGGEASGYTGKKILHQLENIFNHINGKGFGVNIKNLVATQDSINNLRTQIESQLGALNVKVKFDGVSGGGKDGGIAGIGSSASEAKTQVDALTGSLVGASNVVKTSVVADISNGANEIKKLSETVKLADGVLKTINVNTNKSGDTFATETLVKNYEQQAKAAEKAAAREQAAREKAIKNAAKQAQTYWDNWDKHDKQKAISEKREETSYNKIGKKYTELLSTQSEFTKANGKFSDVAKNNFKDAIALQERLKGDNGEPILNLGLDVSKVQDYKTELDAIVERFKKLNLVGEDNKLVSFDSLTGAQKKELPDLIKSIDEVNAKYKAAYEQQQIFKKTLTNNLAAEKLLNQAIADKASFGDNLKYFPQVEAKYDAIVAKIRELMNTPGGLTTEQLREVVIELNKIKSGAIEAGAGVDTLAEKLRKSLAGRLRALISMTFFSFISRSLREIYTNVVDIDTAMTELRKVTQATEKQYIEFLDNAGDRAKNLGVSLKEVVNATADYARLGYSMTEASDLADTALIYRNVGDDVNDIDTATKHLIGTLKGFNLEASDAMRIVDIFNEVSNNFAVSAGDIGEGLQRSSAAMSAAGNSIEQTVAIFTAANTIQQNAEVVGTALKTMSARLRASKTELEDMGEDTDGLASSTSALREELLQLTGVDIMIDDTTFKSTYDILKDISEVYGNLKGTVQANVLEILFGKRQVSIGAGLLENFDIAENAYVTALNSAGSAQRELDKYLESIQGHLSQLTAAWETFSANFLDTDIVKLAVDVLTGIVNILNAIVKAFGSLGSAAETALGLLALNAIMGWDAIGKLTKAFTKFIAIYQFVKTGVKNQSLFGFGRDAEEANKVFDLAKKIKEFLTTASFTKGILGFSGILATVVAIGYALDKWGKYTTSVEYHAKEITETETEISNAIDTANQKEREAEDIQKEINKLKSEGYTDDNLEIQALKDQIKLLEEEKNLYEKIAREKSKEKFNEIKESYERGTFGYRTAGYKAVNIGMGQTNYFQDDSIDYYSQNSLNNVVAARKKAMEALEKGIASGSKNVYSLRSSFEHWDDIFKDYKQNLLDMYNQLTELKQEGFSDESSEAKLTEVTEMLKLFGITVNQIKNEPNIDAEQKLDAEGIENAAKATKDLSSSLQTLSDAFAEQNENGQLSVDTILDVMDAGYAAALQVDKETGQVRINKEEYLKLAQAKIAEQIASLEVAKAEAISAKAMMTEAKAIAEAEAAIAGLEAQIAILSDIDLSAVANGIYNIGSAASSASNAMSKLLSGMNSLLDMTISMLRQEYEDATDATEKSVNSQIDALEDAKDAAKDRWDTEKDALEDTLDAYEKIIDAQIESLRREKEADDYEKNKAEKSKTVTDIQNQLDAIRNDDSLEGQKLRLELEQQLADAQDELNELQRDHEYDMREQALEDAKDKFKDETDAKIKAIEDQSKAEEEAYQKRIDRLRDYLDAVKEEAVSETQLRAEAYDWITNRSDELYGKLIAWNREYGDGLDATVRNAVLDAEQWTKYGNDFYTALENLTIKVHDLEDQVGVSIQNTEDKLAELDEQAKEITENTETYAEQVTAAFKIASTKDAEFVKTYEVDMRRIFATLYALKDYLPETEFQNFFNTLLAGITNADANIYARGKNMIANLLTIKQYMDDWNMSYANAKFAFEQDEEKRQYIEYKTGKGFASGGVVDYTGPAQVHGSASKPEVVFNAQAASKLYEYVVSTPNLVKSMLNDVMSGVPPIKNTSIGGSTNINADTNIVINGNANDDTVAQLRKVADNIKNDVVKSLNESLSRRGITRSPRLV